ncbi:MAG TPA: hypothetical protein VFH68_26395 [Polyangia bacterium]|jgi:hypothetical protein|nr:hypothetical protein [Polyangia bacterium]
MRERAFIARARLIASLVVVGAAATAGCSGVKSFAPVPEGSGGSGGAVDGGATGSGGSTSSDGAAESGPADAGGFDRIPPYDAGGSSDAPPSDAATPGGAGGSSGAGGAIGCSIAVTAESAPTLGELEAYPGARARVGASARGARNPPVTFVWSVRLHGQQTIPTTSLDATATRVEFPVEVEGDYQITVQALGEPNCFAAPISATAQRAVYVLRASAQETTIPVQEKRVGLAGAAPITTTAIQLDPGRTVNLAPTRASDGTTLASYVRVTQPASSWRIEGDTTRNAVVAHVLDRTSYDLLIVPNEAYAPALFTGVPGDWPQQLPVDQGTPVTAHLLDGAGRPLAGARMILRRGSLPSTVGISDGSGEMTLWARSGTWAAFIVPPVGSGLPEAQVAVAAGSAATGIVLPDGATSLDLRISWAALSAAPLSVEVRDTDGVAPVAGVRVRVTSVAAPAPVAMVIAQPAVGPPATQPAIGSVDVEAVTDASGLATFAPLPVGDLLLTVIPAEVAGGGAPTAAITTAMVTLAPAGSSHTVTLAQKVTMTGLLLPLPDSVGARVTAVDHSLTAAGTMATATVDAGGAFRLLVDPTRGYQLFVDPAPGAPRARAALGLVTSGSGPTTLRTQTLPVGHLVQGTVTANGAAVPLVRVQAFCPVWSARCIDPSFSLAEIVTDRDGRFELRVPDPGI